MEKYKVSALSGDRIPIPT